MHLSQARPLLLTLVATGLAGALVAAPWSTPAANADVATVQDPSGDAHFGDLSQVTVRHQRRWVGVRLDFAPDASYPDTPIVWLDVDRSRPGPEFYAIGDTDALADDASYLEVRSVDGDFSLRPASKVCRPDTMRVESAGDDSIQMPIPRRCLGNPGSVRVAVETRQGVGGVHDWSPAWRSFGPWVAHD